MLDRLSNTIPSVAVAVAVADSAEINYSGYAGGMVFIPTGSIITSLTWYAAEQPGGTYVPVYDSDAGAAVVQAVAATNSYPIPTSLFGSRAIKAVGDAAGTIAVSLKG